MVASFDFTHANALDSAIAAVNEDVGVSIVDRARATFVTNSVWIDQYEIAYVVQITDAKCWSGKRHCSGWGEFGVIVTPVAFVNRQRVAEIPHPAREHAREIVQAVEQWVAYGDPRSAHWKLADQRVVCHDRPITGSLFTRQRCEP